MVHDAMPAPKDAIALLQADHEAVSQLFAAYEKSRSVPDKKALVAEICTTLSVHAQIKEEIFYPEVKAALHDRQLVSEVTAEHAGVKNLIAQLEGGVPDGEQCDARVRVLSEYLKHHVKEQQSGVFRMAENSLLDLDEVGARMTARRDDLLARAA